MDDETVRSDVRDDVGAKVGCHCCGLVSREECGDGIPRKAAQEQEEDNGIILATSGCRLMTFCERKIVVSTKYNKQKL